ncbi:MULTISPECIES: prepilin-type N-terminal cleavage/methylation domain-containing protein [unclassified Marinobacterium]|uniref:type IV pilus modification PilV family protein n=1 Tax=unclassified Marinobacterium TaxID=2644139 RepID=UPI00156A2A04|nr:MULTISPECIES: prepilin-type N-terminal cleavage/methylation domain-containing protein [unclassified Marinobacterium]NRP26662.1 hypothetical protein [Marinobacterium sp. xm-d-420]NRP56507.1 hypothetical protein [Marinobacterium sp. xm-d-510]NRP96704.1 hypothetical protein [Marinobacterium sp. xm-a-127]
MISKSRGFTLIEVLIALVVIGVGLVGVVQFQGKVLKSATDSELRSIAYSIAESELERVRSFSSKDAFFNIADGTASASLEIGNDLQTFDYSIYVNAFNGSNSVADNSLEADKKVVSVSVVLPYGGNVNLSTVIALIDPGESGLNDNDDGLNGTQADIQHNPGQAPDVIAIDLGNNLVKETSKPLPEISQKGTSTEVQFESITYDPSNNTEIKEDFVTINCSCTLGGIGSGLKAAQTYLDPDTNSLKVSYSNEFVSKATGSVVGSDQSYLCDRCCRDHHDEASAEPKYRWYWPSSAFSGIDGDHDHFPRGSAISADVGDDYLENCRFKRVDGVYRLMQDWRMIDLTVMPSSYLSTSSGLESYTTYVASVAEAAVNFAYTHSEDLKVPSSAVTSITKPTGRDLTSAALGSITVGQKVQVLSRALMLDPLSSSAVQTIWNLKEVPTDTVTWMGLLPLYEVNTTLLSEWTEDSSESVISVYNQPVVTIVDPDADYYGTYRRGLVDAVAPGTALLSASSAISNTGLVGHRVTSDDLSAWTDQNFDGSSDNQVWDSINVEVVSSDDSIVISGLVDCVYIYYQNANADPELAACKNTNTIETSGDINVVAGAYTCSIASESGHANFNYTCTVPNSSSASISSIDVSDLSGGREFGFFTGDGSVSVASNAASSISIPYPAVGGATLNFKVVAPE